MQYVSAVALASLSGKAPSKALITQLKTLSLLSSRPLANPSMRSRLMKFSSL